MTDIYCIKCDKLIKIVSENGICIDNIAYDECKQCMKKAVADANEQDKKEYALLTPEEKII